MPEKRRKFDAEVREGAVRLVQRPGSRSLRSLVILASTRAPWVTGWSTTERLGRVLMVCPGRRGGAETAPDGER